jgi:heme-degrading monooxygenase HmoA
MSYNVLTRALLGSNRMVFVNIATTLSCSETWGRDGHLDKVPGFVEFHLLKGPEAADHTLYASHTVWENRATFEAWTKSEAFRAAHHKAGDNKPVYLGHPEFEGFEVCQTVGRGKAA